MKEMIYSAKRKREVLANGKYMDIEYYIMNLGVFPTAYIKVPEKNKFYNKNFKEIDLEVNGGVTYVADHLWITDENRIEGFFIGWDYAHYGDYCGYETEFPENLRTGGHKWTTEEILGEVKSAIRQIQDEVVQNNE